MEDFLLEAARADLRRIVIETGGPRLGKIHALGSHGLGLDLRLSDGRILYLSSAPNDGRFLLTSRDSRLLETQSEAETPFVQRLRKSLSGARLISTDKPSGERSVTLAFEGFDPGGVPVRTLLRIDLTGRGANMYRLSSEGEILDALRALEGVVMGARHALPDQPERLDRRDVRPEHLPENPDEFEDFFRRSIRGCGPTLAREIACRAARTSIWEAFVSVRADLDDPNFPAVYWKADPDGVSPLRLDPKRDARVGTIPLRQCDGWKVVRFPDVHRALDDYFGRIDRRNTFLSEHRPWAAAMSAHLKRLKSASEKIERSLGHETDTERWKRYGDLILSQITGGTRTETGFLVTDYFDPDLPVLEIPVEKDVPLTEAAQAYFRRYQKQTRAKASALDRLKSLKPLVEESERLFQALESVESEAEFEALIPRLEKVLPLDLRPKPRVSESKGKARTRGADWKGLRHYEGPDGYDIFVGRTDRDNDRLTFRLARPTDVWLHAADYPGAHVLVRNPSRNPVPHHVVVAAAELAAYFSQAKNDDRVRVHHAERKHLSRPRHAPPGLVLLTAGKSVLATPREVLKRILD